MKQKPKCKCGCNRPVKWNKIKKDWNIYLLGHANRSEVIPKTICQELGIKPYSHYPLFKTVSKEARQKMSDAKKSKLHPLFKKPKDPIYPIEWTRSLRKQIRDRDNNQCQNPNCEQNSKKYTLEVHHIDYDPKNCDPANLITICKQCNIKANHNKKYWAEIYQNIIKSK